MSVRIRYMGAKHGLAGSVADIVRSLPDGPFIDLFSGMCSVAGALASSGRQVWCNDIQAYAATVARALVMSGMERDARTLVPVLFPFFRDNMAELESRFSHSLKEEQEALSSSEHFAYADCSAMWHHVGNDPNLSREAGMLRSSNEAFPYRLATITFAHGYFGLRQSIELDSLRYGIDEAFRRSLISQDEKNILLTAMLQVASQISTSAGHFAQFLSLSSAGNFSRLKRLRKISPQIRLGKELEYVIPFGGASWRSKNKVFGEEALNLLHRLSRQREDFGRPIVYADPPYSKAQYSRYYHVLESLLLYDYPVAQGKGRYRAGRFQTPFSLMGKVESAFASLVETARALNAFLVISYPTNGLLFSAGVSPQEMIRRYYPRVETLYVASRHSTLGGSPGHESRSVQEMIIVGRGL